tara:strand:+ start:1360 stop:2841 length:1482 start_codon:yes stop_codon:yes gene_type:complete
MADQGLLGQSKPAATTNTILYSAPINSSASAVLNIANDGTGAAYDVAIKDYDQDLTLDASTYKLHPGDLITSYRVTLNTALPLSADLFAGTKLTSTDGEKSFNFESFYVPPTTEIDVKSVAIRQVAVESVTGTFAVGETITKGTGGNTTTTILYGALIGQGGVTLYVGPSTLNGSGSEFADGDSVTSTGGATATISTGGVGTAGNDFVLSTNGTLFNLFINDGISGSGGQDITVFGDRVYKFDVSDSSMSGLDFSLSTTVNGEWGPDGTAGNSDDGTEYTTGRTTSGTAGSGGAYVQYDFTANSSLPGQLYFYEGTTGTAANSAYGGANRLLNTSSSYTYTELYIYDKEGTWVNSTDGFTFGGATYTVTAQTAGPYGWVRSYSGTSLKVILGTGSAAFAGTDTFRDVPKLNTGTRTTATVSSVTTAQTALAGTEYIAKDVTNASNAVAKLTSIVIGPGENLIVESATQNNVFSLIGFEDASTAFTTRVFGATS